MSPRKRLAAAFLLVLLAASELCAQDRFWDPARTAGNWNTTTAIWGTTSGGPYTSTWVNGLSPSLDAAPGGSTATLTAAISTSDLFFYSGNFTIAAGSGGSLTTADGAFIVNRGVGGTNNLLINTPVLGAAALTFVNEGGGATGIYLNANNTFSFGIFVNDDTRLGIGTADPAVGPVRSGTLNGDVSLNFTSILSFQSTQTYSGLITGFTTSIIEVISPPAGNTTLTFTSHQNNFIGKVQLGDNSILALDNNGTTTFGSVATASQISLSRNATLDVTGHTSGTWTLPNGTTLVTSGTTSANGGRILGNSRIEGTLALTGEAATRSGTLRQAGGNMTVAGGATLQVNVTSWSGTNPGADFSQIVGVGGAKLDLSAASSANRIALDIRGESLTGFDAFVKKSWAIADFSAGNSSGGILGFSADKFQIDASSFGQDLAGGSFAVTTDANSNVLTLNFTPVPEPTAVLGVAVAGLGILVLVRRRLHRAATSVGSN